MTFKNEMGVIYIAMKYLYNTDLLDCGIQLIAQQCNCVSKFGKGLSKSITERYRFANFYDRKAPSIPGTIEARGGKGRQWILAMYAQYHPGAPSLRNRDTPEQRINWFEKCLEKITKIKNLRSIAFPSGIGCGLAKGNWEHYHDILSRFAAKNDFEVYIVSREHMPIETPPPAPTYETTTLLEYTDLYTPYEWEDFFESALEISIPKISEFLSAESGVIYPPLNQIYRIFNLVKPRQIKVVIIGQDPYHDQNQAMGISFSVPEGIPPPPSLRNIYKELETSGFVIKNKKDGNLTKWCEQGVFLINTALTVCAHTPKSHSKVWTKEFTPTLLSWMNEECEPLVVILWGKDAQILGEVFDNRHRKIKSVHPSPLSASKGFFGSDPFNKANKYIEEFGRDPIDWSL